MPKSVSKDLFYLIQSLTKAEKKNFRLFVARRFGEEVSVYVKLFNAIEEQKVYNEEEILRNEKEITPVQISNLKNYLYDQILKCLHMQYGNISADSQLKQLLHYVEILNRKGLYRQCYKVLMQAKNLALSLERYSSLVEIVEWEQKVLKSEFAEELDQEDIDRLSAEALEALEKVKNLIEYRHQLYKLHSLLNTKGNVRSPEESGNLAGFLSHPLLKNENLALSKKARLGYYLIVYFYHFGTGNRSSYHDGTRIVEYMESNHFLIREDPSVYVAVLNNLMVEQVDHKRYDKFLQTIKKLRGLAKNSGNAVTLSVDLQKRIFFRSYQQELMYYCETGQFKKGLQIVKNCEEGMEHFRKIANRTEAITMKYYLGYLFFGCGNYSRALYWINQVLNESDTPLFNEMQIGCRILNLLVHYELKNYDLIYYIIKSTYHFFAKRERLYKAETIILTFIRKNLTKGISDQELKSSFRDLHLRLLPLTKDPYEKQAFRLFDIISWLESKIQNRLFAELKEKKAESRQ